MSILSNALKSDLNTSKNQVQHASQDVLKEYKNFLNDIEDLFQSTTSLTGEDLNKAKAKLKQRIASAKESVGEAGNNIFQHARKTATVTNHYVHEQPWAVIGAGAMVSFLLGALVARRY